MYSRSGASAYRRVDLESAPSHQIVDRLYERFARDMAGARAAIVAKDIHAKARELDHALCIVVQLKVALDHTAAPEMCANLEALYDFVIARIGEANMTLQVKPLDQATKIMAELATAFLEAPR
ncbi:MAG TPA: flagellar export chaperone FliS [Kofleriaceae bacterium]|nr:flagellar export chaperone FliS [Kofleriaceae bacterium]